MEVNAVNRQPVRLRSQMLRAELKREMIAIRRLVDECQRLLGEMRRLAIEIRQSRQSRS